MTSNLGDRTVGFSHDNAPLLNIPYIAHVAIGCKDLEEAKRFYEDVIGAWCVREKEDRVTFSVGGVLQLVCHLTSEPCLPQPPYPRHFGLTFKHMSEFHALKSHFEKLDIRFAVSPGVRFPLNADEHHCMMVRDPSGNVIEFKCYLRADQAY
jgi:uncharacterized protein